jgi:hypothetical protein
MLSIAAKDSLEASSEPGRPGRKPRATINTTRVQLELTPQALERLARIKEKIGASSYADTIREALWVHEGLIQEIEQGSRVIIKRENGAEFDYRFRHNG